MTTTFVPAQRAVVAASVTLRWQPTDSDGEPVAATGTVTVGVVRSDGSEVLAPGTATVADDDARTVVVPASETTHPDILTATWSVDGDPVRSTTCEVVGGVYATVDQLRALEPTLDDPARYTPSKIKAARAEVEAMFEDAAHRAFVPRFRVDTIDVQHCTSDLVLRRPDGRSVRWVTVTDWRGSTDDLDVSDVTVNASGIARRRHGWPVGRLTVGYEHGLDFPPADLMRAIGVAVRVRLNTAKNAIPDRAVSFTQIEGGTVTLATPGTYGWITGIPEVDEALKRYRWHEAGVA